MHTALPWSKDSKLSFNEALQAGCVPLFIVSDAAMKMDDYQHYHLRDYLRG